MVIISLFVSRRIVCFPSFPYDIFGLGFLDFWFFIELAILKRFSTWHSKNSIIPICMYFQNNYWWLNLVTYVGKCVDFVLPVRVTYVAHFLKYKSFYVCMQKTREKNILLNLLGCKCKPFDENNPWELPKIQRIEYFLMNVGFCNSIFIM